MAIICREKKLLYLLNPRTGSSALAKHLIEKFGGENLPPNDILNADGSIKLQAKHNTVDDLVKHELLNQNDLKGFVVFTNVRNPYDSLVSLYEKYRYRYREWRDSGNHWVLHSRKRLLVEIEYCQTHSFNEWITSRYWKAAAKVALSGKHASIHFGYPRHCSDILHMETLNSDFAAMLKRHGISGDADIPVYNKTESKQENYRDSYNSLTAWLVRTVHRPDFEMYGYSTKL